MDFSVWLMALLMQNFPKMIENRGPVGRPIRMRPRPLNTFLRLTTPPVESLQYVDGTSSAFSARAEEDEDMFAILGYMDDYEQ